LYENAKDLRTTVEVGRVQILMVQCLESWFLADKAALEKYYGRQFMNDNLPGNPNIEEIPKQDVVDGLKAATRGTDKRARETTTRQNMVLKSYRVSTGQR
jgi:hypothetical protein